MVLRRFKKRKMNTKFLEQREEEDANSYFKRTSKWCLNRIGSSDTLMWYLIRGMKPEWREDMRWENPETPEDVLEIMLEFEKIERQLKRFDEPEVEDMLKYAESCQVVMPEYCTEFRVDYEATEVFAKEAIEPMKMHEAYEERILCQETESVTKPQMTNVEKAMKMLEKIRSKSTKGSGLARFVRDVNVPSVEVKKNIIPGSNPGPQSVEEGSKPRQREEKPNMANDVKNETCNNEVEKHDRIFEVPSVTEQRKDYTLNHAGSMEIESTEVCQIFVPTGEDKICYAKEIIVEKHLQEITINREKCYTATRVNNEVVARNDCVENGEEFAHEIIEPGELHEAKATIITCYTSTTVQQAINNNLYHVPLPDDTRTDDSRENVKVKHEFKDREAYVLDSDGIARDSSGRRIGLGENILKEKKRETKDYRIIDRKMFNCRKFTNLILEIFVCMWWYSKRVLSAWPLYQTEFISEVNHFLSFATHRTVERKKRKEGIQGSGFVGNIIGFCLCLYLYVIGLRLTCIPIQPITISEKASPFLKHNMKGTIYAQGIGVT